MTGRIRVTQKPGAVLFAKDVSRVAKFYERLVPMTAVHAEAELIVLESASFQLIVHGIPTRIAKSIPISVPPKLRSGVAVKLVFPVKSLAAARTRAKALGGELNPKRKEFEARGFVACDGHDPEGNVVQFRENAR
jgi:predicted enzyme related to lactoylglutathione lyase